MKKYESMNIEPDFEKLKAGRVKPEVKDYEVRMWADKIPVYCCTKCGRQMDSKDRMILHVVGHYPEDEREEKLDSLLKE